jgi:hypothetical protein
MKSGTVKKQIQPRIDHGQGQNLFMKLFEKLFSSSSSFLGEWKPSKYGDTKRCQNSTNHIRKMSAKKKRLRKIRKRTIMASKFPNRSMIRI